MSTQFFSKLSQNYIELLGDDEYYDITIEVGEDPNVKIIRAHMNILCYRSPYLRRALVSNKKNKDNVLAHIKLPKLSPEVFQIILKYIYGGVLSLNEQDNSKIIKILLAADELLLQELVDYLQVYLIENKSEWMEQNFELIHRTSFQSNSLIQLQQFCTNFMVNYPEKVFKSFDFTSLPEKSLVQLIKRDDLQMKEIEVWEHLLKWGLAQNPTLLPDPDTWSDDDFNIMENTLQHCMPLVRFFSLSSKEFLQKVHPYKKLLKRQLYENLLSSHLDPDSEPTDNITLPRNIKMGEIIDSKIINNLSIISIISRRIDKVDVNNNFIHLKQPYKFQLLLRGSRDGFTPKKFHELCNDIPCTVTFIKVKGTDEILGGYNPIIWKSHDSGFWAKTKDSFIFSFKNNSVKDAIISNVENKNHAVYHRSIHGPHFGSDIFISSSTECKDYEKSFCRKYFYEKMIRDIKFTEQHFLIEEYEVFQITNKLGNGDR
ncbi:uncharacterized protein OCT59_025416 [Rhizophagus irregularis]|uniref:Kelch-like protein 17 n=2 Tax=Rhizophagus irregularis TaxID=588596 RepID=A0A015JCB8_RHIIW|nr:hypothetical protein RirG_141520 [Rhizophagus irregularis DAOM 197198w]UZO05055.1 hypothetical protein OCT59_025416 [Rhizophagus irregularis]GBC11539.1 hypothetical protein GLOIN_2v1782772 [Rhizophagus irregularis DAOM 181602=DAOM 197198]